MPRRQPHELDKALPAPIPTGVLQASKSGTAEYFVWGYAPVKGLSVSPVRYILVSSIANKI